MHTENMKISQAAHKAFLYRILSFENNQAKQYPLEKLDIAIATSKKLTEGSETKDNQISFVDGEQTFTAEEWVLLKDNLSRISEASLAEGPILQELKTIFKE